MILEELREKAGLGETGSTLANELLTFVDLYENKELTREEFEYLVNEIKDVRAAEELSNDEIASRWIVKAATALLLVV